MKQSILILAFIFVGIFGAIGQSLCGAMTTKGTPCKMKVEHSGLKCYHHGGAKSNSTTSKLNAVQCSGQTKAGTRCKNKTTKANGKCHLHG